MKNVYFKNSRKSWEFLEFQKFLKIWNFEKTWKLKKKILKKKNQFFQNSWRNLNFKILILKKNFEKIEISDFQIFFLILEKLG